jgi:O-antigen/teichoic acid export membrane protein
VGMLGGAQFVIHIVAGPKYAASAEVLQIQGIALIATFVLAGWSYALLAMKRYKEVLLANLIAFVVSCAATLALASSHGAVGAAVATVCGETVLAVGSLVVLVRGHRELRPRLGIVAKVALAAVPAVVLALLPGVPSLARALLALLAYGLVIVLTRAVPEEAIRAVAGTHAPAPLERQRSSIRWATAVDMIRLGLLSAGAGYSL